MSNAKRIRWGILGVANINNRLLPAFRTSQTAELRAIASRDGERAKKAARDANIPVAHGSYEALLDDPEIDAIYNPLPNSLHAEWTMKAAERGKHILCEKPLCPTAKEAEALVAFCRAKGVRLMDGFMWPHHPRTRAIRRAIDDGEIGVVQRVTSAFTFKMEPLTPDNIRLQPNLGGGSLLDVGCYTVFAIRWAFGVEPVKAFARAKMLHGVDVEMTGQLEFADGRLASFDCGFTLPYRGWLEITGSAGIIRVPEIWLPSRKAVFEVERPDKTIEVRAIEFEDQIVHMLDDFAAAIVEQRDPQPSPDEAVKTLRVLDALTRSAREGRMADVAG